MARQPRSPRIDRRQFVAGADTLVVACYGIGNAERYGGVITGTEEAAEIARTSGVGRVILSHAAPGLLKPGAKQKAVDDVARTYHGTVLFPDELTTVELPPP